LLFQIRLVPLPSGDLDVAVAVGDSADSCLLGASSAAKAGRSSSVAGSAAKAASVAAAAASAATATLERAETQPAMVVEEVQAAAPAVPDVVVAAGEVQETRQRKGLLELAVELGPAGLMVGWKERLVHVVSIVSVQLLCYDNIKQALHLVQ
jgi:hypothetical protein